MTAGRGIVHSEMPCGELPGKGLQLWVNLRAKDKMTTPEYQELDPSQIPVATQDKVTVKGNLKSFEYGALIFEVVRLLH